MLDDDIEGAKLGEEMRGFATSLDVRCEYCHVGEEMDLTKFNFPADDKSAKRKTRLMLKMVANLNATYLPQLSEIAARTEPILQADCITCHRGQPQPLMLGDILLQKIESEEIDAAIAEYRYLRERAHGGSSYNFTAGVSIGLGEHVGKNGDAESAIRLLELEIEVNGESPSAYYTLSGIRAGADLINDAINS